ncbi:MAG: hypothetical protein LC096_05565, partial [Bacteroidia bacterium]|nr:hypothetical protein [Bacteroidia bacterium]
DMRIIGQGMYFQQRIPKNWGELPMGATLGDELGGVGYIGADGSNTGQKNALPLPTDSQGNIVDVNGNLMLDVSGNPIKSKEFTDNSSNEVSTSIVSAPEEKSEVKDNGTESDKIFGMTKKQFATGVLVGVLSGIVLYYGYKKFIKKATV